MGLRELEVTAQRDRVPPVSRADNLVSGRGGPEPRTPCRSRSLLIRRTLSINSAFMFHAVDRAVRVVNGIACLLKTCRLLMPPFQETFMQDASAASTPDYVALASDVVSAYVSNNSV